MYNQKQKNNNSCTTLHNKPPVSTICGQPFRTGKAVYYSSHKAETSSGCFSKSSSTCNPHNKRFRFACYSSPNSHLLLFLQRSRFKLFHLVGPLATVVV